MSARLQWLLVWIILAPSPLAAEQAADTSLAARLERAERMIQVLQEQMAEQAGARVAPREGNKVDLGGTVLLNGFYNNAKVNSGDLPTIVLPPDPPGGLPVLALDGTARQTELTFTVTAPRVLGASFTGQLDADFYGGQLSFARLFPLLHLRRTRAELRWPNAWVMFGADAPPISGLNPSTFAARGIPGFTNAGNLWFWIPQVRVGADAGGAVRVGLEAAALAPTSMETPTTFQPEPSRAERSKRPTVEARVVARWERTETSGEIGIGGHYGWFATTVRDSLLVSRAVAATARFTATRFVEVRGEAFLGQSLASLGGGGIGQDLGPNDVAVRTRGGWAQINFLPRPEMEIGGGYGFDDPDNRDLDPVTARLKNVTWEGHLHLKPGPLILAVEFRRIETTYGPLRGTLLVNHFNLAMGFRF
jgi:hypothetical protein